MVSMNRVYLAGNLTRDPELRKTNGGASVAELGLAVSEPYTNKAGEKVESTCFADVVVWGAQAEACKQYLIKGSTVLVEGRLELDTWETERGEKRNRLKVRANRVQFLGRPRAGKDDQGTRPVKKAPVRRAPAESEEAEEINF